MDASSITQFINAAKNGDKAAAEALYKSVFAELKRIAQANRRQWWGNSTLNTTALINEAYLKLAGSEQTGEYANRVHFYATASKAMRQILINYAERQNRLKRGGDAVWVTLEDSVFATQASAEELLQVDELLTQLERESPRRSEIFECRVFGGMSVEEVSEALAISASTVKREWRLASALIYSQLQPAKEET